MSECDAWKIAEAIGNHVAAEYEGDPALDRLILQLRAAAKPEPVTIDREALRRAIQGVLWNASNFPAKVVPHMLGQDVGPLTKRVTDAVIAHLAAQPVTGTVEWGIRFTSGYVSQHPNEESARRDQQHPYALGVGPPVALVRRTVSEWAEVN